MTGIHRRMKKMGMQDKQVKLAEKFAARLIVPESSCCGFAGDRGLSFSELNEHDWSELAFRSFIPVKSLLG